MVKPQAIAQEIRPGGTHRIAQLIKKIFVECGENRSVIIRPAALRGNGQKLGRTSPPGA
jgi:hypothetical protein